MRREKSGKDEREKSRNREEGQSETFSFWQQPVAAFAPFMEVQFYKAKSSKY